MDDTKGFKKPLHKTDSFRTVLGRSLIVDRRFQVKYTTILVCAVLIPMIPIGLMTLYFLNQNYNIFMDLALTYSPNLVTHLERERTWINSVVGITTLALAVFFTLYGLRMTGRMIAPLLILREQIRTLAQGKWDTAELRVRDSDEFHDLVEAYQYFYKYLRSQTLLELEQLKKVQSDVSADASREIISQMINEKNRRLNIKES